MVNEQSKIGNTREFCYTCNKSPHVESFVLMRTEKYELHLDMRYKSRIIVTPNHHVETIIELGKEDFWQIYSEMDAFLKSYGVTGYNFSVNSDNWARHSHLHARYEINPDEYLPILKDLFKPYEEHKHIIAEKFAQQKQEYKNSLNTKRPHKNYNTFHARQGGRGAPASSHRNCRGRARYHTRNQSRNNPST